MPRRRRVKEIQRRARQAAKHPDLKGYQVPAVGVLVQIEDAWTEHERGFSCCPDCG